MALLTVDERKKRLKYLGFGEYNKANIKKLQKYAFPKNPKQWDGDWGINTDRAARHIYNVRKVTKNFTHTEFLCKCGHCTGYPTYMKQVELRHLQTIRDHYKKPMTITSGMRCSYENSRVGGVRNSGHTRGYAADFYMPGVTDSIGSRKKALTYMKKLDNHEFSYGAYMADSHGMYRTASGMGNAMHTETHAPVPTKEDKIMAACKLQAEWMKKYRYHWNSHPTIANSKDEGTCVTYVACALQRLGYLKSGQYIWHDGKGHVTHATSRMKITYPKKKTIKGYRKYLKTGDILIVGDKNNTESGSHICFFAGYWHSNGNPYVWDNHSAERMKAGKKGAHTYSGDKMIIAVVTLQ